MRRIEIKRSLHHMKRVQCSDTENRDLIEKSESHVIVLFLFRFLLLGRSSISRWGSSTTSGRGSCTACRSSSNSRPNSSDERLQVTRLKSLGEKSRPVWLYFNTSSLKDGGDLLWGDGNIVISQNKGSVNTCEF